MADTPPDTAEAPSLPEEGIVRWFNATKRIGAITRPDGSTIFIPPHGLAAGQGSLNGGQAVTFIAKVNAIGPYAGEVRERVEGTAAVQDLIAKIAADLGETNKWAITQIQRIVRYLGSEAALRYVAEALQIEAAGGMLLPDGSRRRTLGGVFFATVRSQMPEDLRVRIFPPTPNQRKPKPPRPEGAPPLPPPPPPAPALPQITWEDRIAKIAALRPDSGKVTSVKVTIIGRPNRVEEGAQFTLLTLIHTGPLPAMPKGIPTPTTIPATTYAVYIGRKQWRQVAEAIQNPEDLLIVEGAQIYDPAAKAIAVFATKTTTKMLQQAQRPPKQPEAQG
jgi:cold shock CspA family protein